MIIVPSNVGKLPPISISSYNNGLLAPTSSTAFPTHSPGDLLVLIALSLGTGNPSVPAPGGNVPSWTTQTFTHASWPNSIVAYYVATTSSHTFGSWGSGQCFGIVLKNAKSINFSTVSTNSGSGSGVAENVNVRNYYEFSTNSLSIIYAHGTGNGLSGSGDGYTATANTTNGFGRWASKTSFPQWTYHSLGTGGLYGWGSGAFEVLHS